MFQNSNPNTLPSSPFPFPLWLSPTQPNQIELEEEERQDGGDGVRQEQQARKMDFHELPRRDLQALCKRNGVRANMTNAAMADALSALPTVDGVEEYVKQPAAVVKPAGKAVVAEEEVRREKQGSPLPRGRRVTAKTTEVPKPDQDKGKEAEKADANSKEDAAAPGVGRRGPGRRARTAPLAAKSEAEKQGNPLEEARREPARPDDGVDREDRQREANKENAPAQGPVRRGLGRRARPAPVAAEPVDQAAEKQGSLPLGDCSEPVVDKEEGLKREANKEDVPVQGAVRRGPGRRVRGAPAVATSTAEPQSKAAAAEEKQGSSLPGVHRAPSKPPLSAIPDGRVEEKEDMRRVAKDNGAPVQGVGRRGPSRRARPAALVSKPAGKAVEEELGSPFPRGRRVTFNLNINSSVVLSTEDGEENNNEDKQLEASEGNVQLALGVGRRGGTRRARAEAAVSVMVPAEKDAPIPHSRRSKVVKTTEPIMLNIGDEENQDELKLENKEEDAPAQGVVGRRPSRRTPTATLEAPPTRRKEEASSTQKRDVPVEAILVRPTRARKPTLKAAAAADEKLAPRQTKKAVPKNSTLQKEKQEEDPQEAVPALLSMEACHDHEKVKEAIDPQSLEQSQVIDEPSQEDEGVVMNEDEILMDEPTADKTVTNVILMEETLAEEPHAITEECTGNSVLEELESKQMSPQEESVQCHDLEIVDKANDHRDLEKSEVIIEPRQGDEEAVTNEDLAADELECKDKSPQEVSLPCHDLENMEKAADHQNFEKSEVIVEPRQEDEEALMNKLAILIDKTLAEDPPATCEECTGNSAVEELECKTKSPLQVEQVGVEHCSSTLLNQEDSPILGLVSTLVGQTVDKDVDEGAHFQEATRFSEGRLDKESVLQTPQAPLTAAEAEAEIDFTSHVDHCSETESSNSLQGTVETTMVDAEDGLICQENVDVADDDVDMQSKNDVVISNNVSQVPPINSEGAGMEETEELTEGSAQLDEDVEEDDVQTDSVHVDKEKESVGMEKAETVDHELLQYIAKLIEVAGKDDFQTDLVHADKKKESVGMGKAETADDKLLQGIASMFDHAGEDDFQTDFIHVDKKKETVAVGKEETDDDELLQSIAAMFEDVQEDSLQTDFLGVDEQKLIFDAKKAELVIDELPQSIATMDKDVEADGLQSVHVDEHKLVVGVEKAQLVTDKLRLSTTIMDEKIKEDCQTDFVHVKEQKESTTVDCVQEGIVNGIVVGKLLATEEMQQSAATIDVKDIADDQLETEFPLDEEQKEGAKADKAPTLTGTDAEVNKSRHLEEEVVKITEEMPESLHTVDEIVQDGYFEINVHPDEMKKVVTADNMMEVTETDDEDSRKENALCSNLPCELDVDRDYSDHITSALIDDISETLFKMATTEPTVARNEDFPLCKNNNEKNTDKPVHENKNEKTIAAGPVAMQENKGAKASKKSADLTGLSLGQLRRLKKELEQKKAKRVALARVDENVCRSNATNQEQVGKLQHY